MKAHKLNKSQLTSASFPSTPALIATPLGEMVGGGIKLDPLPTPLLLLLEAVVASCG